MGTDVNCVRFDEGIRIGRLSFVSNVVPAVKRAHRWRGNCPENSPELMTV